MTVRPIRTFEVDAPPVQRKPKPERVSRVPVVLTPIPWGKRDAALACAVCQHLIDAMPPTLIAWRPSRERHVIRLLLCACGWLLVGAMALTALAVFSRHASTPAPAVTGIPLN